MTREQQISHSPKPLQKTAREILSLAKEYGVAYTPTPNDAWARDVTRLADDDVAFDRTSEEGSSHPSRSSEVSGELPA